MTLTEYIQVFPEYEHLISPLLFLKSYQLDIVVVLLTAARKTLPII